MFGFTPKIFIIEDDPNYSKMLEKRLEQRGLRNVLVFDNGETGLAALKRNPELVILDFGLQGLNGLDTLREIKKEKPKTEVIVLTGLREDPLSQKMIDSGASDFLGKSEESLIRILERLDHLRKKKVQRAWLRAAALLAVVGSGLALLFLR